MNRHLNSETIDRILQAAPRCVIGVLGDMFLDRYLEIDRALDEPSVETGRTAYQVTRVRSHPGAAGTVVANLAALGVGRIIPFAFVGDDGEGYELRAALAATAGVDSTGLVACAQRRTPTYTKPMHRHLGCKPVEDHRLDIKNRQPTPAWVTDAIAERVECLLPELDALLVLDQVSEADCGVVTEAMRGRIERWTRQRPDLFVIGDSRELIHAMAGMALKPNRAECRAALRSRGVNPPEASETMAALLAQTVGCAVFLTVGEQGMVVATPDGALAIAPAFSVSGPTDPVGAGDSTSAGLLLAHAAGVSPAQAAEFGCLIASITVTQIGVTGTATPSQVREAWRHHSEESD
jgi:bifunctional ADP-heptose synthase (sugar kinase/adenylyltransferase)